MTAEETNHRLRKLSEKAQSHPEEYRIGKGDLVSIEVFDVEELTREVRVNESGTIALPLLPTRLHAAGLTEIQLEQKLAEVLETSGMVSRPQVSVTVKERKSKPITIIGAVSRPMVYQAMRPVTLLEVLSEAGGIANDAGNTIIITRMAPESNPNAAGEATQAVGSSSDAKNSQDPRTPPATEPPAGSAATAAPASPPTILTVNMNDLLDTGDSKFNIALQGGDIVSVPRAGIVYVMGAVEHPGGFVLSNDREQMSVLKVLALSGGVRPTARLEQAIIMRKGAISGQPQQEVQVNLKKVMERKTEDVQLRPSDILIIPESGSKKAMRKLAEVALAVGTGAVVFRVAR